MQLNKFLLNIAPSVLAAMLNVTASSCVFASDLNSDENERLGSSSNLSGLSLEALQAQLEAEEAHNEEIFQQKIAEEEKRQELIRRIKEAQADREILLGVSGNSIPQAVGSTNTAVVSSVQSSASQDLARESSPQASASAPTVPREETAPAQQSASSTIAAHAAAPAIDEEAERQRFVEQATLKYEIALGEKIGQEIQSHFIPYAQPSMRKSLGLAYEGFVITLPLIAKYCTGQLPWRDQGEGWLNAITPHAHENGAVVKHGRANGLYNGQRPGKTDHFDSLQLVKDCWYSNQGFHAAGIQRYALGFNAKALIGQTKEEYIEAAVENWRNSMSAPISTPSATQTSAPMIAPEAPSASAPASSAAVAPVVQSEGHSIHIAIGGADVKRLEKNVRNEGKKLEQKVKSILK